MKKTAFLRRLVPALLSALVLSGCALNDLPVFIAHTPWEASYAADQLRGTVIDPRQGFRSVIGTPFTQDEVRAAMDALVDAGILTRAELDELELDQPVTRAMFIRLTAAAAAGKDFSADTSLPGEPWYAPYVTAGYGMDLFPQGESGLSFLPVDGFLQGETAWPEMLEPITRGDAKIVYSQIPGGASVLSAFDDGLFHEEGLLSQASALVGAVKVLGNGVPTSVTAAPLAELLDRGAVVHAGGYIENESGRQRSYTNSAEALLNAYSLGARVVEIDFTGTSDGHLACIHDWEPEFATTITKGEPLALSKWLSSRVYGSFTPMCLESLASFMRQRPDLYVVTDVKDDNVAAAAIIADTCPDLLDRFVIQIYHDNEYEPITQLGFANIIFTLYRLSGSEGRKDIDRWREFAAQHDLTAITLNYSLLVDDEEYVKEMISLGVPVCTHTVNKEEDIEKAFEAGVSAVYTDHPVLP